MIIKSDKGIIELEGNPIAIATDLHCAILCIYDSFIENGVSKKTICELLDESIACALKTIKEKE